MHCTRLQIPELDDLLQEIHLEPGFRLQLVQPLDTRSECKVILVHRKLGLETLCIYRKWNEKVDF